MEDLQSGKLDGMAEKIDSLTNTVLRMEAAMVQKEQNIEAIIEEKVTKYLDEQRDRERRQLNLVLHNIAEDDSEEIEDRKKHDLSMAGKVLDYLSVEEAVISKPLRLGRKREDGKPRLLKVEVGSITKKKEALSKAKQLKDDCKEVGLINVYLTPDLSPQQRETNFRLRRELKERREQGEVDLVIRGEEIVKTRQNVFQFRRGGVGGNA